MSHLGERASDLVDGRLTPAATEKALVHVASCRECRDALDAERLLKSRLRLLSTPEPDAGFLAGLMALGGPEGPLPARPGHVPGSPRPETVSIGDPIPAHHVLADPVAADPVAADLVGSDPVDADHVPADLVAGLMAIPLTAGPPAGRPPARPGSGRPPARPGLRGRLGRPRTRVVTAVAGAIALAGVAGAGVGVVSAVGHQSPTVRPPVANFAAEHAATTGDLPFVGSAGWPNGTSGSGR